MALVRRSRLQSLGPRAYTPPGWTGHIVPGGVYRGSPPGNTETLVALLPPPRVRDRLPPVVFCHGILGFGRDILAGTGGLAQLAEAFANAGHPVLSSDMGGPVTWGAPDSQDAFDDTVAYAAATWGTRTDKVAVWVESHGGPVGLQWAARNITRVSWVYASVACVGLAAMRTNPVAEAAFGASIDSAFGGNAAYLAALPTVDPSAVGQTSVLRALGPRLRCDAGTEDIYMLAPMYDAFVQACPGTDFRWWPGGHDAARRVDGHELARWSRALSVAYS